RRIGTFLSAVTPRPVVALFFPMSPEFVAAYFGALYASKQALPLNLLLPPEELAWIIKDSGADLILAPAALAPKLTPLGFRVFTYPEALSSPAAALPRPV